MPLEKWVDNIGFSQNDCFLSFPQLFIYGLYANILSK